MVAVSVSPPGVESTLCKLYVNMKNYNFPQSLIYNYKSLVEHVTQIKAT